MAKPNIIIDVSIEKVAANINSMFANRKAAMAALCHRYKLLAERSAQDKQGKAQGKGNLWTNRTSDAIQGVQGIAEHDADGVRWGLEHTAEYGKWLEKMGKDPSNATVVGPLLEPTVRGLHRDFQADAEAIFSG